MSTVDSPEEFTGSNDHRNLIKRKRTKRQRPSSPFTAVPAAVTTTSSSSTAVTEFHGVSFSAGDRQICSIPSPIVSTGETTTYESSTTEEEEDMANCLILLAQSAVNGSEKLKNIRKFNVKSAKMMIGSYGYECKTCNRTFNSFQALGGHRASHKRPKSTNDPQFEYNNLHKNDDDHEKVNQIVTTKPSSIDTLSLNVTNQNKSVSKIHECSICGAEFSSGQALGGHMRRHRTVTTNQIVSTMDMDSRRNDQSCEGEQGRNNLLLDLNLPAPEDDHRDSKFQLMFSSPALVDCHY